MTRATDETDIFARFRARNELVRELKQQFGGRGLNIRERDNEVVISSLGHPEKGSVHFALASGEVSHRRVLWDYLGSLPGYGSGDPDEPGVDTDAIATIFTRPDATLDPVPESDSD